MTSGRLVTNSSGVASLVIGRMSYGFYALIMNNSATPSQIGASNTIDYTTYQARPSIMISPGWANAIAQQQYTFRSSLVNNATGTLITGQGLTELVYVNNALYNMPHEPLLSDSGGNVTFSWTPPRIGQYQITVSFPSQSFYAASSITIIESVTRRSVMLIATETPPNVIVGQPVSWDVYAQDMINNISATSLLVSLFLNGSNTTTVATDSSGNALFNLAAFTAPANENITFVSHTNNLYNSATSYNPMSVLLNTTLTMQAGTITVNQQNSISVTLKDQNGNALGSRTIQVTINGAPFANITTSGNGQASFNWSPSSMGNYTVSASYSTTGISDAGYDPSSSSVTVTVKPQATVNTQSTGNGTQSVTFQTAQGNAQPSSDLSLSVTFPAFGWTNVKVVLDGQTVQGTLHVWNQFGGYCVASAFGACVMWLPYWRVHFDMATNLNGGAISLVTDFFSASVQSATSSFFGIPGQIDSDSAAFNWGQNLGNSALTAAVAGYLLTLSGSLGIAEAAAAPVAVGILWGVSFGGGVAGFLGYHDKASRMNFFAGLAWAVGTGIIGKFIDTHDLPTGLCNWPCIVGTDIGWPAYWLAIGWADPVSRVELWMGWITLLLASLEVLSLIYTMP